MSTQPGLRERKKQRTRETIARVAVELFEERGYDGTTLADIADAADVSTRTIFSYFPSKEDILFCDFPELKDALAAALEERPGGKDALETVRDFILASAGHVEKDDLHHRRVRIVDSDDELRSRERARLGEIEELVAAAIARDLDATPDDLRPRLVAASLVAAIEVIDDRGDRTAPPKDVERFIEPVIAFLRGGLEALTSTAETRRPRTTPQR